MDEQSKGALAPCPVCKVGKMAALPSKGFGCQGAFDVSKSHFVKCKYVNDTAQFVPWRLPQIYRAQVNQFFVS